MQTDEPGCRSLSNSPGTRHLLQLQLRTMNIVTSVKPIYFQVSHRGNIHPLSLLPDETLAVLQTRLEELTSVPPPQQKLLYKGKKPSHGESTTLQDAGFKDAMKVQLLGATAEELGGMRKAEDEQRRRENIMRERAVKGTVKVRLAWIYGLAVKMLRIGVGNCRCDRLVHPRSPPLPLGATGSTASSRFSICPTLPLPLPPSSASPPTPPSCTS